jgi:hypothetical protein
MCLNCIQFESVTGAELPYLPISATDVNDVIDDYEADPEYNVLADEEEAGEKFSLARH